MDQTVFTVGTTSISGIHLVIGVGTVALVLLISLFFMMRGQARQRALEAELVALKSSEMETRLASLLQTQAEMTGRMQTMAEVFGSRQADLTRAMAERLDGLNTRLGDGMNDTTKKTQESLAKVHERLAVIDKAQANIQELTGQVGSLSQILANKQARGAFGQGRMEVIIKDGLPLGTYAFQATLSNNTRPDALILMPNDTPPLIIDAKFPLEGWVGVQEAESEEALKAARQRFTQDVLKHVKDIAEKYLIPGETQDMAFLFLPSESIFADLHEHFPAVIEKAQKARVLIVSPSLLMLSIQVVQAVLKDVRMREQAHLIQKEVAMLAADMGRLNDRVLKLQTHFGQANKDIEDILTSTGKVMRRSGKIEALEFDEPAAAPTIPTRKVAQPKSVSIEEAEEVMSEQFRKIAFEKTDLLPGE